ncbi:conserved hypothetical protein [Neospora caninum Liverpool]|uniref:Uncharacterized protein n=1 Tax=Neospora caninum (strain Liverpool) TaxID=572307 RepID=F0VF37_NEOCL|nr:conserved hypothetical protein [Neospora caninum Liverpool]CBZ52331.1 conserved hypothetical protein [Neospora caninum Liverpool]CEL66299.1 TPA: hypothetical protein BN1204_021190 [Neospora caninum Liverpool]|eukprot:XP_003882363.1 conserved hypothetical protein [Neospora caninum Liverpool]
MLLPNQLFCVASATMLFSLFLSEGRRGLYEAQALRPSRATGQDFRGYEDKTGTFANAEGSHLSAGSKSDDCETAEEGHENMRSFAEQAGHGIHATTDEEGLVSAAARIAQLNPEETVERWHAEQARGTQVGDFLDKLLGTKNIKVTDEERERIKPFAPASGPRSYTFSVEKVQKRSPFPGELYRTRQEPALAPRRETSGFFLSLGGAHKKSSDEKESDADKKSWGSAIGEAVDYAGDKVAEGWNALAARFTSPQSNQVASEAAARTAEERGDVDAVSETAHRPVTELGPDEKKPTADGTMKLACECRTAQAKPHH